MANRPSKWTSLFGQPGPTELQRRAGVKPTAGEAAVEKPTRPKKPDRPAKPTPRVPLPSVGTKIVRVKKRVYFDRAGKQEMSRIVLDGAWLSDAGFTPGMAVYVAIAHGVLTLTTQEPK